MTDARPDHDDRPRVLISGASIAGPALAFWLHRHGFAATVVERAPSLRRGGQAVDVRGVAREVAARMGLLDAMQAARTGMRGMSFVGGDGAVLMSTTESTLTGGATDSPDIELLRDDLGDVLYGATRDDVAYRFDDSIAALDEHAAGVSVRFARGDTRDFALVVGADGLHSHVRRLAFGPEGDFVRPLGIGLAVFTTPNFLGLDHWQVFHRTPTGMAGVYSARGNAEARAILGFAAPPAQGAPDHLDRRDVAAQMALVAERFAGVGWEVPRLLAYMRDAPDFHYDAMAQVHAPRWSSGRVALVGDAACCSSPMSGQGTSIALVGAYVLAAELARASDLSRAAAHGALDHAAAFARYESRLRPWVARNQALALDDTREGPPPREVIEAVASAFDLDADD